MLSNFRVIPRISQTVPRRGLASNEAPPMMWRLAHGMFDPETSMTEKFPGIPDPVPMEPPTSGPVEITTLPNGVRVASQDLGGPVSSVGLFVGAGSRHETPYTSGVSYMLEQLAFKGSSARSKFRMIRDMERTGATFAASTARETIAYTGEGLREQLPDMVSIISETAVMPVAAIAENNNSEWDSAVSEIKSHADVIKDQLEKFQGDGVGIVTEAVHAAAFHGNTLGNPLVPEERKLAYISPDLIASFVSENFTPDRIVLSASNVEHGALVEMAAANLGGLMGESGLLQEATYTGGSRKISADGPAHVAIGFKGVSWHDDDMVPVCVLHTLLGGGGSFSSGGPGKGMYTRLYSEIMNRHGWVSSAMAFNHCYSDTGLFGIQGSCDDPAHLNNLVEVIGLQVGKMAGPLSAGELDRAKAMTKSSLIMNLESRAIVSEDIGRQVLTYGKYAGGEELSKKIDEVTEDDIRRVAAKVLDSSPAVVTYGEEYATHEYAAIESSIKKQAQISS